MSKPPPIRVLLADDEPAILDMFSSYLRLSNFEVTTAIDGAIALKLLDSVKPDIIILDIKMPKVDGWEACERIKNNPQTCGIPVVFLTAFDQQQDHERARRLCVQGYVTKPCEPADLVRTIQKILSPTLSHP
jgi:CheY-like chemotaxis protein